MWSQVGHKGYDYMSSHICDIVFTSDLDISYTSLAFKELSFQCKGAYTILNKQVIGQLFATYSNKPSVVIDLSIIYLVIFNQQNAVKYFFKEAFQPIALTNHLINRQSNTLGSGEI